MELKLKYLAHASLACLALVTTPASAGTISQLTADGQTFDAYFEEFDGQEWLLIGRGREGWEFDADGQGAVGDVSQNVGTPAAFAPKCYSDAIIIDLLSQQGDTSMANVEMRLSRASDTTGTVEFQDVRWTAFTGNGDAFTWNIDNSQYSVTTDFKNAPAGLSGAAISTHTGSNTRDANHSNNARRIFTWAWGGHNNLKGFSYGQSVDSGTDSATNFLWEGGNQGHAIGYTEVYIPYTSGPDETPPAIATTAPADNSSGAYPGTNLVATFDENIVLTGTGTITVTDGSDSRVVNLDGSTDDGDATVLDNVLTITLDTNLTNYNATYDVLISSDAIVDTATIPNPFAGTVAGDWNFTTAVEDLTAPVITLKSPLDDATGVSPSSAMVVTFDDDIVAGSGDITIYNVTDSTTAATIVVTDGTQVSIAANVLTISPTTPLAGDKEFAVQIADTAIENYTGVAFAGIADNATWSFTTVSSTTYAGATGAWNADTWNNPANWDAGVPSGGLSATIAAGEYASTQDTVTPAYTGNLTLGSNSTLEIGQTGEATALNVLGGGTITMNTGSDLTLRYTVNSTHPNDIIMAGDALIALGRSTSAHSKTRTFTGAFSGSGQLTVHVSNNNTMYLKGNSASWSGGLVAGGSEDENKSSRIEAEQTNALGTGNVTLNDGMGLQIDSPGNAIGDSATLSLSGGDGSLNEKLVMNASDTVGQLVVDGYAYPAGTYGKVGHGGVDYEYSWIGGNSILTVAGTSGDSTAPTVTFDELAAGGSTTDVFVGEPVTYTLTLSEPLATDPVAGDFENTPGPAIIIESITPLLETGGMTTLIYEVVVSATEAGTLNLGIQSGATLNDLFGNALSVPTSAPTTFNVNAATIEGQYGIWKPWANGGINPNTENPWAAGDTYRIVATTVRRQAGVTPRADASSDIAVYNDWVNLEADTYGAGGIPDVTWSLIGSTPTVSARQNTGTDDLTPGAGGPFVKIDGNTVVAKDNADLWDGSIDSPISISFDGTPPWNSEIGTGTGTNGLQSTVGTFGDGDPNGDNKMGMGYANQSNSNWTHGYSRDYRERHYYAMSEVLTVQAAGGPGDPPYTTWAAGSFLGTLTDPTASLDFDGGGLETGIEWVVGGDPTDPSDDADLAPTGTEDGVYLVFTYIRTDVAEADTNTTITVEYASTLAGWTTAVDTVAGVIITETDNGATDTVEVKIPTALAAGGKLFARLNVVIAP